MAEGGGGPMMTQYRELKRRFPDHLLLFRLGDFYELFFEDAELGARLLSITLTARQGAPMAGIPHHAADAYVARLVQAGQKIAICEQMEGGGKGKKLLRRDIVRVVTPGTLTDTAYLAGAANNFLMAAGRSGAATGVALLDVSTGEFWVGEDGPGEDAVLAAALVRRPALVHADVEALRPVLGAEHLDGPLHQPHQVAQLARPGGGHRPQVTVDDGHQVSGGVGIGVQDQERVIAARQQKGRAVVVAVTSVAEYTAGRGLRRRDPRHAPRRPQALHAARQNLTC